MPIRILLGALAAMGVGGALGTAQGLGQRRHEEDNIMRKIMSEAAMSGAKIPPDVISKYFSKDAIPAFNMLAETRQAQQQQDRKTFENFGGGSFGSGGSVLTQPPSPSEMVPGDNAAPEWALPGPVPPTPNVAAFMPQTIRPSPGGSMSYESPGGLKMSKTVPGTSEAEAARVGMEADRLRADQQKRPGELTLQEQAITEGKQKIAKSSTEAEKVTLERDARVEASGLISKAAESSDPREQLKLLTLAHAAAIKGGLHQTEGIVSQINNIREKLEGKKIDPKNPDTAEWIATNKTNPHTGDPVSEKEFREAKAFTGAQTKRKADQVVLSATTLAKVQTDAIPQKVLFTNTLNNLTHQSDTFGKFRIGVSQIRDALNKVEADISALPKTAADIPAAQLASLFQTPRGAVLRELGQIRVLLQGREPRLVAGEVGRIPYQLEQQWGAVSVGNLTLTQRTTRTLLASTRDRLNDMERAYVKELHTRARQAANIGIPKGLLDAYVKGETDTLRMTLENGVNQGILPPVLQIGDFK